MQVVVLSPSPELHLFPLEQDEGQREMLAQCSACFAVLQSRGEGCFEGEVLDKWWMVVE